jgi:hypothetical protein
LGEKHINPIFLAIKVVGFWGLLDDALSTVFPYNWGGCHGLAGPRTSPFLGSQMLGLFLLKKKQISFFINTFSICIFLKIIFIFKF